MSKRNRKNNIRKQYTSGVASAFARGVNTRFPRFIEQEHLYIDVTRQIKPYTRSIILHVKQNGKELGAIQMTRRP